MVPNRPSRRLHAAWFAGLAFFGLPAASFAQPSPTPVTSGAAFVVEDEGGKSWTIGNAEVVFRVGHSEAAGGFGILGLDRPSTNQHWNPGPASDLAFTAGGRRLVPGQGSLAFQSAQMAETAGGVQLALVFEDSTNRVRVTRYYACVDRAPGLETWSAFEAFGTADAVTLSDIGVWQVAVPATEVGWVTGLNAPAADGGRFTRRTQPLARTDRVSLGSTGRSADSAIPAVWLAGPEGRLFAGLMWSGAWSADVTGPAANGRAGLRLALGGIATSVRPGQPFEGPHGFFGIAGPLEPDVSAALQKFARFDVRRGRPFAPQVVYNTWFAYGIEITEEIVRAEMDHAAALGVEVFVVDAGWYAGGSQTSDFSTGLGSWTADPKRFPSGLGALSDYAHGLGMKFGIWIEPERVDTKYVNGAGLARESWLAETGGRYNPGVKNSSAGSAQICLASPEARQWVIGQIARLIADARPDYLKWDNNYWINCDRSGHGHDALDGNLMHVKGLYTVLATLRERYPNLVIENCAGGGNRMDFGMLQYTDTAWMDDESAPSEHVRHNLEGLSALFPSEYLLSFVMDHPDEPIHGATDPAYTFRSRLPGVLGMSLRGAEFGDADLAAMKREIELAKELRGIVFNPTTLLLTSQVPDAGSVQWDAVQVLSDDVRVSALLTYSAQGSADRTTIRLRDLLPDAHYVVRTLRGTRLGEATGDELMQSGLGVPRRTASAANLIVIERVDDQAPDLQH